MLVLKPPKTKTSIRKVYLPRTVAELLAERKAELEELSEIFGEEFVDYGLVICHPNGRPMEGNVINNAFQKLIKENGLPRVVFHSLRYTSTTYKLRLSGGDIKAVQGDTGHSQATMVTDRYAHIMDDDRRINTAKNLTNIQVQKMFDRFYTVNEARKSTGLGLSIAKTLVTKMGGEIKAEYSEDKLTISVRI